MPWLALPWLENADDPTNRSRKDSLSKKFKVNGIPTLIILNSSGTVISFEMFKCDLVESSSYTIQESLDL